MRDGVPAIGVIGGSGLSSMEGLTVPSEHQVETPGVNRPICSSAGRLPGGRSISCPATAAAIASCRTS